MKIFPIKLKIYFSRRFSRLSAKIVISTSLQGFFFLLDKQFISKRSIEHYTRSVWLWGELLGESLNAEEIFNLWGAVDFACFITSDVSVEWVNRFVVLIMIKWFDTLYGYNILYVSQVERLTHIIWFYPLCIIKALT